MTNSPWNNQPSDPYAQTQSNVVVDYWEETRPTHVRKRKRNANCLGCLIPLLSLACLISLVVAVYLLTPLRTNILLLGIDRAPEGTDASRSDTIILMTTIPLDPYIGMLSIPRDLWVNISGIGENRINTAHFFAENVQPGSGPEATMNTILDNFGVDVDYYVRIRFSSIKDIVEVLGGIDLELESPMAGYPAGVHHLNGDQALAFVRDRKGSDDFFRMEQGQLFSKQLARQIASPRAWPRWPSVFRVIMDSIESNLPIWEWPRLAFAFFRAGPEGIDNRVISREMVNPFTTENGANVLLPDWAKINPLVKEMFEGNR